MLGQRRWNFKEMPSVVQRTVEGNYFIFYILMQSNIVIKITLDC